VANNRFYLPLFFVCNYDRPGVQIAESLQDICLLLRRKFLCVEKHPSDELFVVVEPGEVLEVVDVVVAVLVEDLELDGRQYVLVEHLVDQLNCRHILTVQSVLDLEDILVVEEVGEDGL